MILRLLLFSAKSLAKSQAAIVAFYRQLTKSFAGFFVDHYLNLPIFSGSLFVSRLQ